MVLRIEVIGLGALNLDNIYQVERIIIDGETIINSAGSFPGGSAANTIYGLAKLRVNTGFIGAVGGDAEGKLLLRDFRKVGVDASQFKVKPKAKTGTVLCLSDKLGRRSLYVLPGANNLLTLDEIDIDYVNQTKFLHISSFVDDKQFKMTLKMLDRLDSRVKVSFSPGALYTTRGMKALNPILARTHVLFINQSEIRQLTGEDLDPGAETCLKQGCRIVVVTLGKGVRYKNVLMTSYIRVAENEYFIEPIDRKVAPASETTGAGDAFACGFLYAQLKGKSLEECGYLGNLVAQFSIKEIGARLGLPTLPQLSSRYKELYNKPR